MKYFFLRTLVQLASPHRSALIVGMLFMLVESAVALAVPWFGGRFASDLMDGNRPNMNTVLLLLAVLFTAQTILRIAGGYIFARLAVLVLSDLRVRLYQHVQSLPLAFFQQRQQGAVLSILSSDVSIVSYYLSGTVVGIVPTAITILGSLIFMLSIDKWMAVIAAIAIPAFYMVIKLFGRGIRPLMLELQEAYAQAFALEEETLSMLPAIKTFTRESVELVKYQTRVDDVIRLTLKEQRIESALGPGVQWLAGLGVIAVLWFAGDRVGTGTLGTGALVTFLLYTTLLTRPVSALANVYGQTQRARASMERLQSVLAQSPERYQPGAPPLAATAGRIDVVDVTFAYPNRPPVLRNFSLTVAAHETVAITGENGTGKTTLISLLVRLIEPHSGRVLIDGVDIASVSLTSLRTQIAVVPQLTYLFNGTVRDNIAYGEAGCTAAAIQKAAEIAQAHEFISSLPEGYETVIGDHGVRLSGGQRQRVALARALVKDPAILILDEATAMFDPESELHFLEECREMLRGRTVLLVTHRPASLALADRVIRLSAGAEEALSSPRVDLVIP